MFDSECKIKHQYCNNYNYERIMAAKIVSVYSIINIRPDIYETSNAHVTLAAGTRIDFRSVLVSLIYRFIFLKTPFPACNCCVLWN